MVLKNPFYVLIVLRRPVFTTLQRRASPRGWQSPAGRPLPRLPAQQAPSSSAGLQSQGCQVRRAMLHTHNPALPNPDARVPQC